MPNLTQFSEDPVGSESKLTSRNWRRPSSPRYETARWADSTGMMSCTKVIFSERIRSMGGQLSMNLSIIPSIFYFPGTKQKLLVIWNLISDLKPSLSPVYVACVCVCLVVFIWRTSVSVFPWHLATAIRIGKFHVLSR